MAEFSIIPILGRKVDVAQNDLSLFKTVGTNLFMTHDVGGVNFDLERVKSSCSKAKGRIKWSSAANASAIRCLGLFELWDGTNRNHIFVDAGNIYYLASDLTFTEIEDAGTTAFASDEGDLYSFIRIGDYLVFADRAEHTPYKWKHGDANLTKLIASGTEYKFRYLNSFQRRVIGCYSDQTDGEIELRWSTSWPGTAISSLNFPAANQLYVPNDDPITGTANLGTENCFIYCEDSINQLVYVQDYASPFRIYTIVPDQGCAGHHSIVNMGNRHFFFSRHYGFCEYRGGGEFPYGGRPISESIESDIGSINSDAYRYMVGTKILLTSEVAWAVPIGGATNNAIFYYNYLTGQWRKEDKAARYIDSWRLYSSYTWTNLVNDLISAGYADPTWTNLLAWKGSSATWADITSLKQRLTLGNIDGHLYYVDGNADPDTNLDGYRIEPVMDFSVPRFKKLFKEIWFEFGDVDDFSITVYHRMGDTVGEVTDSSWTSLGTISCNSPDSPSLRNFAKSARLHQIKWGTAANNQKFQVNRITFKYEVQSEY